MILSSLNFTLCSTDDLTGNRVTILLSIKSQLGGCNCSNKKLRFQFIIFSPLQSKNQSVQLVPEILQSAQEMLSEFWKSTVFIKWNTTRLFLWLSVIGRSSIYFAVHRQLIGTSSDTQFLKFHTVLYRWS